MGLTKKKKIKKFEKSLKRVKHLLRKLKKSLKKNHILQRKTQRKLKIKGGSASGAAAPGGAFAREVWPIVGPIQTLFLNKISGDINQLQGIVDVDEVKMYAARCFAAVLEERFKWLDGHEDNYKNDIIIALIRFTLHSNPTEWSGQIKQVIMDMSQSLTGLPKKNGGGIDSPVGNPLGLRAILKMDGGLSDQKQCTEVLGYSAKIRSSLNAAGQNIDLPWSSSTLIQKSKWTAPGKAENIYLGGTNHTKKQSQPKMIFQ